MNFLQATERLLCAQQHTLVWDLLMVYTYFYNYIMNPKTPRVVLHIFFINISAGLLLKIMLFAGVYTLFILEQHTPSKVFILTRENILWFKLG